MTRDACCTQGIAMTAPLTYAECMARLMACKPMARGERGATMNEVAVPRLLLSRWAELVTQSCLGGRYFTGPRAHEAARDAWRRLAAPLRRAREERQRAKDQAARIRAMEAERDDEHGALMDKAAATIDALTAERDALRAEVARLNDPDTLRNINARDNIARIKNLQAALEEALDWMERDNPMHTLGIRTRIRAQAAGK